jgi:hypothetical protein
VSNLPARIAPQDVILRVRGRAVILDAVRRLMNPPEPPLKRIGFGHD